MNKIAVVTIAALAAGSLFAQTRVNTRGARRGAQPAVPAEDIAAAGAKADRVTVDQYPKLGSQSTLVAPNLGGGTTIGQCWTGKPRKWIVLEAKYTTESRCTEQLAFTWHVILDTKTCTNKDKEGASKLAPYSYFTQTVTYQNIPKGSHAASVCLHPSYLERYGEPKAIGLVVMNSDGKVIAGDSFSEIKGIAAHTQFWEEPKIMEAKQENGEPMIERRQGLQDRSKTIWALVNPNDYEMVAQ